MGKRILVFAGLIVSGVFLLLISSCEGLGSLGAPAERKEGAGKEAEKPEEPPEEPAEKSEYLGSLGGKITFRGCTLGIPRNVLREKEYFTVKLPSEQDARAIRGTHYSLLPTGKKFDSQVLVTIGYDPGRLIGVDAEDLVLAVLANGNWQRILKSEVDIDAHTVRAAVSFLGEFAVLPRDGSRVALNSPPEAHVEFGIVPLDNGSQRIDYDAGDSIDSDGRITKYDWDYDGDGVFDFTSSDVTEVSHVFPKVGWYTTILKVTDDSHDPGVGFTTAVVEVDELFPPEPPSKLTMNIATFPTGGKVPITINFAASAVGGLPPYHVLWDFGGGDTAEIMNPSRKFTEPGTKKLRVFLSDESGQEIAREITINLKSATSPEGRKGQFRLRLLPSAKSGRTPLPVTFTLKLANERKPVHWKATFGDEPEDGRPAEGSGRTITHTYTAPGYYLARVIATDSEFSSDSAFELIDVKPSSDAVGKIERVDAVDKYALRSERMFLWAAQNEEAPLDYLFELEGRVDAGASSFRWDFGDGFFSSEASPAHEFVRAGVYEVVAEVSLGSEMTYRRFWLPAGDEPLAAIQLPDTVDGLSPFTVSPGSIAAGLKEPIEYAWDFGDGGTSSSPEPLHTYSAPGTYEMGLSLTGSEGETAEGKKITIVVYSGRGEMSRTVAFTTSSRVAGKPDRTLKIIGLDGAGEYVIPSGITPEGSSGIALSPGGGFVGFRSADGLVLLDAGSGEKAYEFIPREGSVESVFASKFGDKVFFNLSIAERRSAYLFTPSDGLVSLVAGGENAEILGITAEGDAYIIRHWSDETAEAVLSIVKWNYETESYGEPVELLRGVGSATINADGSVVLALTYGRSIYEISSWRTDPGEVSGTSPEKSHLSISSDGDTAAWLEASEGGAMDIILARRTDEGFLDFTNLTNKITLNADSLKLLPDGNSLVVHATASVPVESGDGEETETRTGLFVIDVSADEPSVKFLAEGEPEFAAAITPGAGA